MLQETINVLVWLTKTYATKEIQDISWDSVHQVTEIGARNNPHTVVPIPMDAKIKKAVLYTIWPHHNTSYQNKLKYYKNVNA